MEARKCVDIPEPTSNIPNHHPRGILFTCNERMNSFPHLFAVGIGMSGTVAQPASLAGETKFITYSNVYRVQMGQKRARKSQTSRYLYKRGPTFRSMFVASRYTIDVGQL
jgi:hypothetical protein